MRRVVVIVGLPGSGKTTYAETLGGLLVDDASRDDGMEMKLALVSAEPLVVITDPMACSASRQHINSMIGDRILDIVCFENDPEACWTNINKRGDNRISKEWLMRMSESYFLNRFAPDVILPVYKQS